jgi:hypothetical protein
LPGPRANQSCFDKHALILFLFETKLENSGKKNLWLRVCAVNAPIFETKLNPLRTGADITVKVKRTNRTNRTMFELVLERIGGGRGTGIQRSLAGIRSG